MRPLPLGYLRPFSVDEALDMLAIYGLDGKVLAGGQSLLPMINLRLARPKYLLDINRVSALSYIRLEGRWLHIGAMTRHADLERSEIVKAAAPLLHEAVKLVGHPHIRFRGTIGGSLAHADPAAELPAVVSALGGRVVLKSKARERIVPAQDFFVTYLTTCMEPDELLVEVRLPVWSRAVAKVEEITPRHGDFAIAGTCVQLAMDEDARVRDAAVSLMGVGPGPVKASAAEQALIGDKLTETAAKEAARLAAEICEPEDDMHASAAYRRRLVEVLTFRAILHIKERSS